MIRIFALFLLFSPFAIAQSPDTGLRQILDDQTAAWNRGDLAGFMQGYWHSHDVTFFSGDQIIKAGSQHCSVIAINTKAPAKRWVS